MHSNNADEFLISKERLAEVVENNQTQPFQLCYACIENIISALKTNIDTGIIGDQRDVHLRRKAFGSNFTLQERSPQITKCFKRLILDAFKDTTILLLLCCATLSLVIGIKTNGQAEAIIDGTLIFLAASSVVTFAAILRFFKARWMIKKSLMRKKKFIWVVRNGKLYQIPESELVVGDIVCLHMGDCVPADGIFIHGDSFQLNDKNCSDYSQNPSLFTGAKVVNGHCRMLVTSVGENTERSRLIRSIGIQQTDQHDPKPQLLDAIEENNSKLEKVWLSISLILLVVQLVRCFVWKPVQTDKDRNLDPKGVKNTMEEVMNESIKLMKEERSKANGLVGMLCILLLATRDGLPLAVFISLLYASRRMKSCDAIIQKLPASATVGLITTICTGKTSDLVLQYPKMAELWIGFNLVDNFQGQVDSGILDALREGIFVHSSGDGSRIEEISLIAWARAVLGLNFTEFHGDCSIIRYEAPDMDRNLRCSIVKRDNSSSEADEVLYVHWKGAPELILSMCSHYYTVDGKIETLDDNKRLAFLQIVQHLVACSQYCFAFAYKQEMKEEDEEEEEEEVKTLKTLEHDLTLLGFVGLKNPYSPEVREAIEHCQKSGVHVKLMVEDDINTARIMAVNSGVLLRSQDDNGTGGIVEAADFRTSSEQDRVNMIDNIHVMANASPADKLLMMQCLRKKGEIVAATASSIRDSPLLKEAHVGIFMGDECADYLFKEDGDILVVNKTFSQIPGIVKVGKRVCENLEKFIQLQLTLEISAFAINIISVAVNSKEELSSFQVLWINLIMEILGALAVAITTIHTQCSHTERGNSKQVYGSSGAVITRSMYRSIAVQSLFQVTIVLILGMKGKAIFQFKESVLKTMIFNCYAFCQVFLLITAMELKKKDVVVGLFTGKSCLFLGIVAIIGILQVALVEIMGVVAHWSRLDFKQWCICIGIASFSVPLRCAANWIPITTPK